MTPFENTYRLYDDIYGQRIEWEKFLSCFETSFGEKFSTDLTIIDFGCGTGFFGKMLAPNCKTLFCVDISKKMLEASRFNLGDCDNVEFLQSGVSCLKTIKSADMLISTFHVVNYLREPKELNELFNFGESSKGKRKVILEFWTQDSIVRHSPLGVREREVLVEGNQKFLRQSKTNYKQGYFQITHTFFDITNFESKYLFSEEHLMKPVFLSEMLSVAERAGFFFCGLNEDFYGNPYTVNSRQCVAYFMEKN